LKARTAREPTLIRAEADDQPDEAAATPHPELRAARPGEPALLAARAKWRRRLALSADDRAALGMWGAAHLALLVLAWAAAWVYRTAPDHAPLAGVFEHWDAVHYRTIAQYGYFSPHSLPNDVAFFPGYPLTLAAVHLALRSWVVAELVLSAVAGCFAVVSLSRLAGGRRAVLYLLTAPTAVFLMVGYAECLFLALAIPAWHAASRGRWWRAALLTGCAGLVRPDGVFLTVALAVMALTGPRGSRLANAGKACCGLAGPAAYEMYLRMHTGSWQAWATAKQAGWGLHLVMPVQALKATWWAAFGHHYRAADAFAFQLELAALGVILLATFAFRWRNRWPESTYCGLAVLALGTQTWYQSCPRTLLVLFPIWIALARLETGRPWVRYTYLGVSAPLAAVVGLLFLTYQLTG
jgi:hypothetical protein